MPTFLALPALALHAVALPALRLLLPVASAEPAAVDARFALALYCNPVCSDAVFDGLERDLSAIPAVDGFDDVAVLPGRLMGLADTTASPYADEAGFAVPDQAFIDAYGAGVERPGELQESQSVILVWFSSPRDQALATLVTAHSAFANAAKSADGWVEDLDTQTLYGQATWAAKQPAGPLTDWFVVENSQPSASEPPRLVTRGLRRFGDRDLVMDHVPAESAGDAAHVLNAVAITLHAAGAVPSSLDIASADARGTASLLETPALDGDPEAPLLSVQFKGQMFADTTLGAPEPAVTETVEPLAAAPATSPPPPAVAIPMVQAPSSVAAPPPRSLAEAQGAMRARLNTAVRSAVTAGLPPGEAIAVSVPFPSSDGGREYLWVELQRWEGSILGGVVVTQPSTTRSVQKGQSVTVEQAQVFDYVWKHADGSREGNTTAPFLQ